MKQYLWTYQVTYRPSDSDHRLSDSDAKDKYTKQGVVNIKRSF